MKYYVINYKSVKEVDRKTYLKLINQHLDRDYITWYDDGVHVFIGVCNLDERDVIAEIVNYTGQFKREYGMWY